MNIAIITARGGSKRIPRKNVRPFLGKPMVAWPIEAALQADIFDHVFVSTDDEEIAEIAARYGAQVPYLRPAHLADDYTPAHKAARQMLEWALTKHQNINGFCHIYPTAPMLQVKTLREGMQAITSGTHKSVWAMAHIPFPIYQFMGMGTSGKLFRFFPEDKAALRSQDMPKAFIDVGQAYFFNTTYFLKHELAVNAQLGMVEVPMESAIDIDTEADWLRAEKLAQFFSATSSQE